jgi:membrane-associated phospholipid phosphatase
MTTIDTIRASDKRQSLGAPDAPGTAAGWRHFPWRTPDLRRFAMWYVALTAVAIAIGAAIVHVLGDGPLGELDLDVARWFADRRTPTVNHLAQIGAGLADAYTLTPAIVLTSIVFVVLFKRWNETVFLVTSILLEKAVFVTTTFVVARDRPPVGQLDGAPPTSSYPSGHTAAAVVFYVCIALVVTWHTRHAILRVAVWIIAVLAPVAVAVSRMVLGMHYLTDVMVGMVLGGVALGVGSWLSLRTLCDLDARVHRIEAGGSFDRGTEAQQRATERDDGRAEPRGAEAQPRERVAGPMHAQQDA